MRGLGTAELRRLREAPKRRICQRVALILLRELAMNRRMLAQIKPHVRNTATEAIIPVDFALSQVAIESAGLNLSELPPEVLSDIIGFYQCLRHMERVFQGYERATEAIAGMEDRDTLAARETITNKRNAVDQFKGSLDEALRWCDTAMEELGTIADDPDWKHWVEDREAMIAHDPTLQRAEPPSLKPRRQEGGS
jgi:hypothetical protein